ncbi:NUDIX domain-containing protein [Desulfuromonas sp. CSMB_57]|jgi:ADP-ribose pyrophosphatase|uniref:ADP-ribose pyrophosphatase n=1 Tax=Desulfuromonas sp. CSMB_57 TaxID=2807629 RepID=UPI001CD2E2B8|nr:NUDIX domain-containing protein [Desulfuromonas sp. CSMB_57]
MEKKSKCPGGWPSVFATGGTEGSRDWLKGNLEVHVEPFRARFEWPDGYPRRIKVSDDLLDWDTPYPDYEPPYFVAETVLANDVSINPAGWADPEDIALVAELPRESFEGPLLFDAQGRPLNPRGRCGIAGRGLLGKWGPNFAADPIVTRLNSKFGDVELLAVQRRDNGLWAIPGGMVDRGEEATRTLVRELAEETGVTLEMGQGRLIYRGFVDDPRTTDHAWIETTVRHLHLDETTGAALELQAGSDARRVNWLPLTEKSLGKLYAGHGYFVVSALAMLHREQPELLPESVVQLLQNYYQ